MRFRRKNDMLLNSRLSASNATDFRHISQCPASHAFPGIIQHATVSYSNTLLQAKAKSPPGINGTSHLICRRDRRKSRAMHVIRDLMTSAKIVFRLQSSNQHRLPPGKASPFS